MLTEAALAQLGERQTEDLKVPGSIPGGGTFGIKSQLEPPWPNGYGATLLSVRLWVRVPLGVFCVTSHRGLMV